MSENIQILDLKSALECLIVQQNYFFNKMASIGAKGLQINELVKSIFDITELSVLLDFLLLIKYNF